MTFIAVRRFRFFKAQFRMATDTRSPLSMARFDYFRRIFCNVLGGWVKEGSVPNDPSLLESLVMDVCYRNAAHIVGSVPVKKAVKN